jgi:hypothetical protein
MRRLQRQSNGQLSRPRIPLYGPAQQYLSGQRLQAMFDHEYAQLLTGFSNIAVRSHLQGALAAVTLITQINDPASGHLKSLSVCGPLAVA